MNARAGRTIAVLVGTDHHPFQRAVDWADTWAARNPQDDVVVQHGHSPAPRVASGVAFLGPADLAALMSGSDIVVSHGGPATISGARASGHLPLVLARDPRLGEHVDDHQQRFARWSGQRSLVVCVESVQELEARVALCAERKAGTRLEHPCGAGDADDAVLHLTRLLHKHRSGGNKASEGAPVVLFAGAADAGARQSLAAAVARREGTAVLGDVRGLWRTGPSATGCACGESLVECEFWEAVGKVAFGGWRDVDPDRLEGARRAVEAPRGRWGSLLPVEPPARRLELAAYTAYYQALYRAAREVSGADVVVDVGDDLLRACALSHNREIDLRVLWLDDVADPLGRALRPLAFEALRQRGVPHAHVSAALLRDRPLQTSRRLEEAWNSLDLPGPQVARGPGPAGQHSLVSQPGVQRSA
ncbi:hypothetical protein KIH31_07615 [Paenarthrobacter sp. DKR-5]|uniref:glycosyltransferase n=1 Tax=Paenarthrobacter sp. DKR-5 TaxID=2835535 RepID=UPI001BDBB79B|nr:glycosyltransferase [Paenarthrobacter sp. DKR-5]MBT1002468.1 hypothetical protein [Paenarthrobacter sp. DKR-5]